MLEKGGTRPKDIGKLATAPLTTLAEYSELSTWLNTIGSAWNLVYKIKESISGDKAICDYFYYWLGHLLFEECGLHSIPEAMNKIYQQLKILTSESNCNSKDNHSSKDIFYGDKLKFEFEQDYNPKQEQLQKYYEFCNEGYKGLRTNFTPTFPEVDVECKSDNEHAYCTKFKGKYETYCQGEGSSEVEEGCKIVNGVGSPATGAETETLAVSDGQSSPGSTVAVVFGALATYTSLFSGIKNSFGSSSNRRKRKRKRRTTVESDFDTITEDTLTEYSTEASTVGSMEEYTVYDGRSPSGRRGRTNNGRREGNRNNISYQRI
ncbi:Uncharacterized protein PCOAH_00015410 [Plasmodium coatneyi]|uniref:KIR protein n=1 Tax=Plasmodium coatneyi TaxID=208452 RepID=A0A1B1DWZ0_9APIC|nr:Uncharacterized protein PCOAH_00015410 [Plasmodium coatneyi]ANQ07105.1 Uncharacterized protein PCOAH_00015410 [Plasmodium coatneyi]